MLHRAGLPATIPHPCLRAERNCGQAPPEQHSSSSTSSELSRSLLPSASSSATAMPTLNPPEEGQPHAGWQWFESLSIISPPAPLAAHNRGAAPRPLLAATAPALGNPATSCCCTSKKGGRGKIKRQNNRSNTSRAVPGTEQRHSTKAGAGWLSHQATARSLGLGCRHLPAAQQIPRPKREMGKRSQPTGTHRAERTSTHLLRGSMAGQSVPRLSSPPETETTCPRLLAHPSSAGAARRRVGRGGSAHRHGPARQLHRGPGEQSRPRRAPETAPPRPRGPEGTSEVTPPRHPARLRRKGEASPTRMRTGFFLHPRPPSRGHGLPAPPAGRVTRAVTRGRGHGARI